MKHNGTLMESQTEGSCLPLSVGIYLMHVYICYVIYVCVYIYLYGRYIFCCRPLFCICSLNLRKSCAAHTGNAAILAQFKHTETNTHTHSLPHTHTLTHSTVPAYMCAESASTCCGRGPPLSWLNIKLTPHLTIYMLISSCGWGMGCFWAWGILSCGCLSIAYRGHNLALAQ